MATYKIEMMDMGSFNNYMSGNWNYHVEKINIEAETAEEAPAEEAKKPAKKPAAKKKTAEE